MNAIRKRLTSLFVTGTLIVSIIIGAIGIFFTTYSTNTAIQKTLVELPYIAAMAAQNSISTYTFTIGEIATDTLLTSKGATEQEKNALVQGKAAAYYMRAAGYADVQGQDVVNDRDVSGEPFFQAAMSGSSYMSTPYINSSGDDAYMVVSAPVKSRDEIIGVAYFHCDTYLLQTIVADLQVGSAGYAYILDKEGTVIASPDQAAVFGKKNVIKEAESGSASRSLKAQAEIERRMVAGESGIDSYYAGYKKMILSYAPIPNTDGWSVAIAVSQNEFMRPAWLGNFVQILVFLFSIAVIVQVARKYAKSITDPIVACADRLKKLAEGDLSSPVPEVKTNDEIEILSNSMADLTQNFHRILEEVISVLGSIAEGDLTKKEIEWYFPGEFVALKEYLHTISSKLHQTISGIADASEQVSVEASHVSETSIALSQGAANQAETVEMLAAYVKDINEDSKHTAELTEQARASVKNAGVQLEMSNQYIAALNRAMENITVSSGEISKVIATIEEIASQTNMLALNASIEAARAGEMGRGFAVVADEVGALASQSAQAAKATKELIEHSLSAVKQGGEEVEKVTSSLGEVIALAGDSVLKMDTVAQAVESQTEDIQQILHNTDKISGVVQTTAAKAEEGAEISRELFDQADNLKQLVGGFSLEG